MKFSIPSEALKHFKKHDSVLYNFILSSEKINRTINSNYFDELVRSIIYQQVSLKAGETIYNRLSNMIDINPEEILKTDRNKLQSVGISFRKVDYLKNLSEKVVTKELNLDIIDTLSDEDIIKMIIKVKGLGVWSAEMFLMFSLGRLDVSSYNDLAIKRGIQKLYKLNDYPSKEEFTEFTSTWSPYNTVASFYLWEASKKDA
ncbi:DNA-3-methyladenine glycosylase 2 family protein [Mycoplasmatota bacterium]|nr:DNA-3-methyladenine glycosylase 2 family protein [Mycoplasmatota bacterium]